MNSKLKLKGKIRRFFLLPQILFFVIAAAAIVLFWVNRDACLIVGIFAAVYGLVILIGWLTLRNAMTQEIVDFAAHYGSVQKKLLDEFVIPYALLDNVGRFLWVNEQFTKLTEKDKTYHKSITTVFPQLTRELLQKPEITEQILEINNRTLRVMISRMTFGDFAGETNILSMDSEEQFLTALYFFDETDYRRILREKEEQRLVAGLVYIDNYEEVLEHVEDVKQSMLLALVDRRVNKYFSEVDGLVRKIEKDKYFVVFRNKYLNKLKEERFHLIEDVKSIKIGKERTVTLSIGIGATGDSYTQNYEFAHAAIDLALARGGDQAVIREGEDLSYYGGSQREISKNTRVKARVKAHALREMIETHKDVLVMGHTISDPDAFGAAIGVCVMAKSLEKECHVVINEISASLRNEVNTFTPDKGYAPDMFINSDEALEIAGDNTLIMVVDTNRPSYTECPELLRRYRSSVVVFDHHRQGTEVIDNPILSYIEPFASSTCEMVAEVLQYFSTDIKLTPEEADAIYAGILIDTNNFLTKTGVRTFEAAAYLKRCGTDVTRVRKMMRNDMEAYKARAEILRRAEVYRNSFAISVCQDNVDSPTIVGAQAANELLNIIGIKASFVLTEYQNKIFVSSRSIDEINVQLIMERLGGGGHVSVAGCQFKDCTIEEAISRVKNTLDVMIEEGSIHL
ncbi:MAG: DHH family phosphoesterase [Lachnospiraceae bacterium]|nr:DHH family phosphoesterase [Lachnospiraceae bacterium]